MRGIEGNMLHLQAGREPHVITRQCRDRDDAEQWAVELIQRGFTPVIIDGFWFDPTDSGSGHEQARLKLRR